MPAAQSNGGKTTTLGPADQFVGFRLGDQSYAAPIRSVQEIVDLQQVVTLPQHDPCVEGVSNLRGAIIPIINLRALLGVDVAPGNAERRTIVVNVGDRRMGCTVDAVSQVLGIAEDQIQRAADTVAADAAGYIRGFAKVADEVVIVLDIESLLAPLVTGAETGRPQAAPTPPVTN